MHDYAHQDLSANAHGPAVTDAARYAWMLRGMARHSQYSVNRTTFANAAGLIEQLERENALLRAALAARQASAVPLAAPT